MSSNSVNLMEEWKSLREESARKQDFVERLVLTTVTGNLVIYSLLSNTSKKWLNLPLAQVGKIGSNAPEKKLNQEERSR